MKNRSLADKLQSPQYLDNLCDRRLRELMFCEKILEKDELEHETSIQVAYRKARDRFVELYLDQINPDLAERIKEGNKIPIFNMENILEEMK